MIINKFKNSLKRGTGEAILILKENPELDFSDLIINASIKNFAYDPQIEGSREDYLFELIQLSPKKNKIIDILLKNLSDFRNEDWGIFQLFKIAKLFAKNGDIKARNTIYQRYKKNLEADFCNIDTYVLIDLDGFEGFKFIAEIQGMILNKYNVNDYSGDYIFYYAKDLFPDIDFEDKLKKEAEKNKYIKLFLNEIEKYRKNNKPYKRKKYTYNSVKKLIEENKIIPMFIGNNLKHKELIKIAFDLKEERDEKNIIKYLRIFSQVKYPLEVKNLYNFLEHDNKEIISSIIECLKYFNDLKIRNFALNKLNDKNFDEDYLELLIENFTEDDSKLITKLLKSIRNKDKFHSLGLSVLDIYKKNKTNTCIEALKVIYNKGQCGFCRLHAIEIMIENKVLPEYIKQEGIFDSNIEIRELIKNCT